MRCMIFPLMGEAEIELQPIFDVEDFVDALITQLCARDAPLRAQSALQA